jgi:hypothetical protein
MELYYWKLKKLVFNSKTETPENAHIKNKIFTHKYSIIKKNIMRFKVGKQIVQENKNV